MHLNNLFKTHGSKIWWTSSIEELLPENYKHFSNKLEKNEEVFDIDFISGASYNNLNLKNEKIDLITMGKDQIELWLLANSLISSL